MMLDNEILDTILRSIYVSGSATLLASTWSIPLSYVMALSRRVEITASVIESLVGMPTVLLGLLLYFLFSSSGPLGFLQLLYTPTAMIIGEAILITPLIISTTFRLFRQTYNVYGEVARSLGATQVQVMNVVLRESFLGILASIIMGFSRAIGELGIALMVGGNIKGFTRVMTTAIALGVSRGEFESSVVLGFILLLIMIVIAILLKILGRYFRS
ncbi:MAG: ABC transporter permease [Sulfolobales archaeon]